MAETAPLDRLIDGLRSRCTWLALAAFVAGWLVFTPATPEYRIYLRVENADSILINSIRMEFGFDINQSSLLTLQLKPGEVRHLVLNHPPGKGFNVEVHYQDGAMQSFCANRNVEGHQQQLKLSRH